MTNKIVTYLTNQVNNHQRIGRDTTHFDSEDDYRTGCQNVSHCQLQYHSVQRSPGRPYSTYIYIYSK